MSHCTKCNSILNNYEIDICKQCQFDVDFEKLPEYMDKLQEEYGDVDCELEYFDFDEDYFYVEVQFEDGGESENRELNRNTWEWE